MLNISYNVSKNLTTNVCKKDKIIATIMAEPSPGISAPPVIAKAITNTIPENINRKIAIDITVVGIPKKAIAGSTKLPKKLIIMARITAVKIPLILTVGIIILIIYRAIAVAKVDTTQPELIKPPVKLEIVDIFFDSFLIILILYTQKISKSKKRND